MWFREENDGKRHVFKLKLGNQVTRKLSEAAIGSETQLRQELGALTACSQSLQRLPRV